MSISNAPRVYPNLRPSNEWIAQHEEAYAAKLHAVIADEMSNAAAPITLTTTYPNGTTTTQTLSPIQDDEDAVCDVCGVETVQSRIMGCCINETTCGTNGMCNCCGTYDEDTDEWTCNKCNA